MSFLAKKNLVVIWVRVFWLFLRFSWVFSKLNFYKVLFLARKDRENIKIKIEFVII